MSPLNTFLLGYAVTLFLLLASYGYRQEEEGADLPGDQLGTWFAMVMVSGLWPVLWSYYIPRFFGVLVRKIVAARQTPTSRSTRTG